MFLEGLIGHGVDQAEAEQRVGAALGHDVGLRRDDLADEVDAVEPADPLGMEQLAVELGEGVEYAVDDLAVAGLQRVAAAADAALVVAIDAGRIVEYRPQPFPRIEITLEDGLSGLEAGRRSGDSPWRGSPRLGWEPLPIVRRARTTTADPKMPADVCRLDVMTLVLRFCGAIQLTGPFSPGRARRPRATLLPRPNTPAWPRWMNPRRKTIRHGDRLVLCPFPRAGWQELGGLVAGSCPSINQHGAHFFSAPVQSRTAIRVYSG